MCILPNNRCADSSDLSQQGQPSENFICSPHPASAASFRDEYSSGASWRIACAHNRLIEWMGSDFDMIDTAVLTNPAAALKLDECSAPARSRAPHVPIPFF